MNYVDPQGSFRLLTTLEGQWPSDGSGVFVGGVEGGLVTGGGGIGLVGRLGYASRGAARDASRVSVGGGVELGRLHLDYAYRAYDVLGGGTHRVGLRWTP